MSVSSEHKRQSDVPQFKMPPFFMPFSQELNPLPPPHEAMMKWADRFGLVPTDAARSRFKGMRTDELAKLCHPTADAAFLELMADWYAWYFLFDDQFDDGPLGCRPDLGPGILAAFIGVLDGLPPPADNPLACAFAELWARTTAGHRSSAWLRRLTRNTSDFLNTYLREAIHRAGNSHFGIGRYLAHRKQSTAMMMIFDIFEITTDADLPDNVIDCEAFRALRASANLIAGLHNDIIGLEKELARDYPYNLVVVVREAEGCSLQEAVDFANAIISGHVAVFLTAQAELSHQLDALGLDAETRAATLRTARQYEQFIRGYYDWAIATDRHTKVEYTAKGEQPMFLPELLVPHPVASHAWSAGRTFGTQGK